MYVTETLWKSKVRFMTKFLRGLSLSLLVLAFWASWVAWGPSSIRSEILLDVLGVTRIPSPPTYRRFKKRGQKIIQRGSTARLTCSSPWFHKIIFLNFHRRFNWEFRNLQIRRSDSRKIYFARDFHRCRVRRVSNQQFWSFRKSPSKLIFIWRFSAVIYFSQKILES